MGTINSDICELYNLTGVMSRSCGIKRDLRLSTKDSYSGYNTIIFKSYYSVNGDCFDRYLLRMLEMAESLQITNAVTYNLFNNNSNHFSLNNITKSYFNKNIESYNSMEDLINHFLNWHCGLQCNHNSQLSYIESAKGEYGVHLISNNSPETTH